MFMIGSVAVDFFFLQEEWCHKMRYFGFYNDYSRLIFDRIYCHEYDWTV